MKKIKDYFEYNIKDVTKPYHSFIISFLNIKYIKMSDSRIIIKYYRDDDIIIKKEDLELTFTQLTALHQIIIAKFNIYKNNS